MATKFVPPVGMFFYVMAKPIKRVVDEFSSGDTKVIMQQDNSYREDIFLSVGTDSTHVVAKRVYGGYSFVDKTHLFAQDMWTFSPVGPDIAKALGLFATDGVDRALDKQNQDAA